MSQPAAILQVADTGPLESLVEMFSSVGVRCLIPSRSLRRSLIGLGCDTVLDHEALVSRWGYSRVEGIGEAHVEDMDRCDYFVDVKAHRSGPKLWNRWPRLRGRTLWYRINGGEPEHVVKQCPECAMKQETAKVYRLRCPNCVDLGNEVDPPCRIITPNQWYKGNPRAYTFWPRYVRQGQHVPRVRRAIKDPPVCLIHRVDGWGYQALVSPMREKGLRIYGVGSPDGLIQHSEVPVVLSRAIAMIHLKSNDAPGYAMLEAAASACPIIVSRRLIWRCRMQEFLIPGETCLAFDRETHDPLSPDDVVECMAEIGKALHILHDPETNRRFGEAIRDRYRKIEWRADRSSDVEQFREFLTR